MAINFNTGNVIIVPSGFFPGEGKAQSGNLSSTSKASLLYVNELFPKTDANHSAIRPSPKNQNITTPAKFKEVGKGVLNLVKHMSQLNKDPRLIAGQSLLEEDSDLKQLLIEYSNALQQA